MERPDGVYRAFEEFLRFMVSAAKQTDCIDRPLAHFRRLYGSDRLAGDFSNLELTL